MKALLLTISGRSKDVRRNLRRIAFLGLVACACYAFASDASGYDDDRYESSYYTTTRSSRAHERQDYADEYDDRYVDDYEEEYAPRKSATRYAERFDDNSYVPDFDSSESLYADSYGYVDANGEYAPGSSLYEVGSNEYLDEATMAIERRRARNRANMLDASSGLGSQKEPTKSKGLFGFPVETSARDGDSFYERWVPTDSSSETWSSQILPEGLMYRSYLAGRKEPRLQSIITYDDDYGTLWDITLGGRAPIYRFGTSDPVQPEGWEIELEGAALLRLDWDRHRNLAGTDYRAGVPIVYGTKRWQFKTGYYHVSSHLGDNYLMDKFRPRVHYSRDSIMFGFALTPVEDVRLYAEMDYAFHTGKTTDPFEFQFGLEYSPQFDPTRSNWVARPFFATHGHLYQERDFGGYWATQTGVQWRSASNSTLRLGGEFFMGGDDLYQFHHTFQRKLGLGLWYDF